MWIIVIVIVLLIVILLIRGNIRATSQYKVINSKGIPMHMGSYADCVNYAKAQNDYCKAFGIKDSFTVIRWKL